VIEQPLDLRAVSYDRRFLEKSWMWLQDPELQRLTMTPPLSRETQERWFASLPGRIDYKIWGIETKEEPIGAVGIKNIAGASGEYWGYIGEKSYWERGIGRWMIALAVQYARQAGLRQLTLRVSRANERAIRLYSRCGFVLDAERGDTISMKRELA
jgi:RimJ/RimL family protein N-acetyltransferase